MVNKPYCHYFRFFKIKEIKIEVKKREGEENRLKKVQRVLVRSSGS